MRHIMPLFPGSASRAERSNGPEHGFAGQVTAFAGTDRLRPEKQQRNGKPTGKRILVAPQVPSGPVNWRLRSISATCPIDATM